jgi:hypothetical protein
VCTDVRLQLLTHVPANLPRKITTMHEYSDDPEHDLEVHAESALNHRLETLALLGDFRPPQGSADAIAAAQVHTTLAMVDIQIDMARLLSMSNRELNASNMFTLAGTLAEDHPLREIIHEGLLAHLTKQGGLHTDLTLGMRVHELKLEIQAGDDIIVTSSNGEQCVSLLVIDPAKDQWLFLRDLGNGPDNFEVDSPRIRAIFDEDIKHLAVSLKKDA